MNQPQPDTIVMQQVEALLNEQLVAIGIDTTKLEPHEIRKNMNCVVYPDGSMSFSWKEEELVSILPERDKEGSIQWRFFTR